MKKLVLSILAILICATMPAQELPKIIPPSPNAAAFHVYGNTQVNNYTGSTNISIPIFEVKDGDLSVPIYLKYTGGNGIKVEEIASWVGLGWTLNAGGAVSRTIRGLADEDETKTGFFKMTEIPIPNVPIGNIAIFNDISNGIADGEADKFMYNYPGGSGSFFYNYDKTLYLKPKREISINHSIGVESESISMPYCTTYDEVIKDFTLRDELGRTYYFKDKERSNTITYGQPYTDTRGFPSSWYISSIKNINETKSINFSYDTYGYALKRARSSISVTNNIENDIYTETTYISKRLNKITFSKGSVEFIASSPVRKDLDNNKYLDKIIVKNSNNKIIKTIYFNYKYMTSTALVDVNTNLTNDGKNRLILTSIQECDGNNNCKPSTKFTYNTSQYLPNRYSKAQDHWGYYNGKTSNTKSLPNHFIRWYNPSISSWVINKSGSADRSPNIAYAKAGVLEEIEYPTGGKSVFNYESHTAVHDEISGALTNQSTILMWNNQISTFSVNTYSKANPLIQLKVSGSYFDEISMCSPKIYIKNTTTNQQSILSLPFNGMNPNKVLLEAGTYQAWFVLESFMSNNCSQPNPAAIKLSWSNESSSLTKTIGGLRINSISNYENSLLTTKRNFEYTGDDGYTSGRVVNIPKYYRLTYSTYNSNTPIGYKEYVNSITPLATTQGSHVGYGKVTVSNENQINGKEEVYYITSDDFPNSYDSIDPTDGSTRMQVFDGVNIGTYPPAVEDSKDFLRGVEKKRISYKKSGTTFNIVSETSNVFNSLKYALGDFPTIDDYVKNAAKTVRGLKVSGNSFTYYEIFTGYNLPSQTITKLYNDSGTLTQTSTQKYSEDINNVVLHYTPISSEVTDSKGNIRKTNTTYVFNKTPQETALLNKNGLYIPLQTDSYINGTLLSTQKTNYTTYGANYLPQNIQSSKGSNSLEDRITFLSYYDNGNVKEVSKKDGTRIVYIWGYNQTQPIAKIENVTYTEISSYVSNLQNKSNLDINASTEQTLRSNLETLRLNIPSDAMMTYYTYDPLIGVTSVTDPRGRSIYYLYDSFNRLQYVKDNEGNILTENQYNYKN